MKRKFGYFLMTILVLGLIFNTASFSNFVYADSDNEEKKSTKEQKESERETAKQQKEAAKEEREQQKEAAKEEREQQKEAAKEEREQQKEAAKEERESIKEFADDVVLTSSSSSSVGKVTVCHIPPGNVENAHTITIGKPALRAHLAHHDVMGACEDADLSEVEDSNIKESRISENDSNKESKALERAQNLIEKLQQQISKLEERLQNLIEKYQSGEYFGNLSTTDEKINSYTINFEGTASSIYDETVTTDMSGKLFIENQVTASNTSKFNVVSGEIIVGNNVYDVVFGKARSSSSGQSGNDESLVLVMQTMDLEGNDNTIKMTLGFGVLEGNIGDSNDEFEILENSTVSQEWSLEGNGQLSLNS